MVAGSRLRENTKKVHLNGSDTTSGAFPMKIIRILTLVMAVILGTVAAESGAYAAPPATGLVQVFDVTSPMFGAKGNGTADDTTAIQNTINTAFSAGGGIVFFPPGTYKVTSQTSQPPSECQINYIPCNVMLKSKVSLVGVGQASRIECVQCIPPGASGGDEGWAMFYGTVLDHVTIRNLVIFSTGDTDAADNAIVIHPGEAQSASDFAVEDCEIYGFKSLGVRTTSGTTIQQLRIVNNYIHDLGPEPPGHISVGIEPNAVDGGYIAGNVIKNVGTDFHSWGIYATDSSNLTVVGNIITHCASGIAFANDRRPITRNAVMYNLIDTPTAPEHIGIHIRGDMTQSEITGNTILAGILSVFSATNLTITENVLDLQQVTLPDVGYAMKLGIADGGSVHQVTVAHNRITNGKGTYNPNSTTTALRVFAGTAITISNNQIAGFFGGIELRPGGAEGVTYITVKDNEIQNVGRGQYIYVTNATEVTIAGNRFEFGNHSIGIALDGGCSRVRLQGNLIGPGGDTGIHVNASTQVRVEDNLSYPPLFFGTPSPGTMVRGNQQTSEWFPR
jgi:parallel beta-helix repeat protein